MSKQDLWIKLGEELNSKGYSIEDFLGHIAVLNADDSSFETEEQHEDAFMDSVGFLETLEETLTKIIIE